MHLLLQWLNAQAVGHVRGDTRTLQDDAHKFRQVSPVNLVELQAIIDGAEAGTTLDLQVCLLWSCLE